jgi:hypothetical protein
LSIFFSRREIAAGFEDSQDQFILSRFFSRREIASGFSDKPD